MIENIGAVMALLTLAAVNPACRFVYTTFDLSARLGPPSALSAIADRQHGYH